MTNGFVLNHDKGLQIYFFCVKQQAKNDFLKDVESTVPSHITGSESESEFLLVIRLMTFIHQDLWYGKLVPCSRQKGKPGHTILCTFNRGNNQIWKGIPIFDCLREEWALVNDTALL